MSIQIHEWREKRFPESCEKKSTEYLVVLSRSMSGTFLLQSKRGTIMKSKTSKDNIFFKGTNIRSFLVNYVCLYFSLSDILLFYPLISVFFHSALNWALNTGPRGWKSIKIPAWWHAPSLCNFLIQAQIPSSKWNGTRQKVLNFPL